MIGAACDMPRTCPPKLYFRPEDLSERADESVWSRGGQADCDANPTCVMQIVSCRLVQSRQVQEICVNGGAMSWQDLLVCSAGDSTCLASG